MSQILLLHGLIGTLSDSRIRQSFSGHQLLTPALMGYGEAARDAPADWTLHDQADHIVNWLDENGVQQPVHLVGHSVGGAVAVLLAHRYPDRVRSITSVEGNFTLDDAFWSQAIAKQTLSQVQAQLDAFRADVRAWIAAAGVHPTEWTLATANCWLDDQTTSALQTQARAVVRATEDPSYLESVGAIVDAGIPFHLIAGARTRPSWHVPGWVIDRATSFNVMPASGHLMMLEDPDAFATSILAGVHSAGPHGPIDAAARR